MRQEKGLSKRAKVGIVILVIIWLIMVYATLFVEVSSGPPSDMSLNIAFAEGCVTLRSVYDCQPESVNEILIDYPDMTTRSTLFEVCKLMDSSVEDKATCAQMCGCATNFATT